jgi:transposase
VCSKGLALPSFIAPKVFRDIREYTRTRDKLTGDSTRRKNRIERLLQLNGFKLSSTLTDIFGASGRDVLDCLCEQGFLKLPDVIGCLRRVKHTPEEIQASIDGEMEPVTRWLPARDLEGLDSVRDELSVIEGKIRELVAPYNSHISLLTTIPGIGFRSASSILAELSDCFDKFKNAGHLASWAGLAPRAHESADKRKSSKTGKSNKYVKTVLVECAWAAVKVRGTRYSMWYHKKQAKMGKKKAIIGVARKMLECIYAMVTTGEEYDTTAAASRSERERKLGKAAKLVGVRLTEAAPGDEAKKDCLNSLIM